MKISVTDGNLVNIFEVQTNQLLQDVKALIQAEMGIPFARSQLYLDGKLLNNDKKLNELGVVQNSLLFVSLSSYEQNSKKPKGKLGIADAIKKFDKNVTSNAPIFNFKNRSVQQFEKEAERVYQELKDDQMKLLDLQKTHPEIVQAVRHKNINGLAKFLQQKHEQSMKKIEAQQQKFLQLSKNPMNPQYQKMLEQRIHQSNIQQNLQFAHQYIPEVFGNITMLYINASINKIPIQAFVDTGAQSTIMSESLAERCGLMRLVDKRQSGVALGVGSCKILGRIHAAQIQIQKKFITCSLTVIDNNGVEFLLGLDNLKRFNCLVDLKTNELSFQNGLIITKFLPQGQIKKNMHPRSKEDIQPKLNKLISMGFSKTQALHALQSCNYNEEVASNMLMQKKYGG